MAKKKSNIVSFQDNFRRKFIEAKSRKYNLPFQLVSDLVFNQELIGFELTTKAGRTYIEDYLSINAIRYHQ